MFKTKMKFYDLLLMIVVWSGIIPFLATPYYRYAALALAFYQTIVLLYLIYDKINISFSPRKRKKTH